MAHGALGVSVVLIRKEGAAGRITLNRPHALNALNLEMVRAMYDALTAWAVDPAVHLILLDGAGERGLCAGGDIRALYDAVRCGEPDRAALFLREEYRLNLFISRYPKPYVACMDGIVMGGGIGVSGHASHRIVTERSVLAMPETAIGFVPDVGGTYLLGRTPDELGTHLALTSARIQAADAILCGLADVCIESVRLEAVKMGLLQCGTTLETDQCLRSHACEPRPGWMPSARPWISECYAKDSVEEILAALDASRDAEARAAAAAIRSKSPALLKVTLRALRQARADAALEPCLRREYGIGLACFAGHDFVEGVRAAIVDKDRNPKWEPARLEEVSEEAVELHFAERGQAKLHLVLPGVLR